MTPCVFTIFGDKYGTTALRQQADLEELAGAIRMTTKVAKEALPLVKFGTFGNKRSTDGCLRHDANVIEVTGVEGDYDGEQVSFEQAVEIAEKANLRCLVYTSPSHTPQKPRWRLVAPFSAPLPPERRTHMMGRLNGLYGGIFGPESWTLSQSYFFGRVNGKPIPQVAIVDGMYIDQLDELDRIWRGKPDTVNNGSGNGYAGPLEEQAMLEAIINGDSFHVAAVRLLGKWAQAGIPMLEAQGRLQKAFESVFPPDRDARWQQRYNDIPRCVLGIYGKEAQKQDEQVEFVLHSTGSGSAGPSEAELQPKEEPIAVPLEDWPEPLGLAAYHGLAGEVVCAIEPHTEVDPAAILFQFLTAVGNVFGRRAYFCVEDTRHHPNLFTLLVGNTSKSRKGTSWRRVKALIQDTSWANDCIANGLSTGEGLIHRVRDRVIEAQLDKKTKKTHDVVVDPGVDDKRLLVIEEEFARPLRAMQRPENILSAVLREAWDGDRLQVMTKKSPAKATGAHISVIAHVTRDDLLQEMDMASTANGFGNRFLFCRIKRSKLLPLGGRSGEQTLAALRARLIDVTNRCPSGELCFDHDAEKLWRARYDELSADRLGMYGAITARGEAQVIRLALLYALLDQAQFIGAPHLEAALEVWRYADASARSLFGDKTGSRIGDSILSALRVAGTKGMTRTEIRDLLGHHVHASRIDEELAKLAIRKLARWTQLVSGGRPTTLWRI
jgi:Protein of unknown function (DUF3987)